MNDAGGATAPPHFRLLKKLFVGGGVGIAPCNDMSIDSSPNDYL